MTIRVVPISCTDTVLQTGDLVSVRGDAQFGTCMVVGFSEKTGNPYIFSYKKQMHICVPHCDARLVGREHAVGDYVAYRPKALPESEYNTGIVDKTYGGYGISVKGRSTFLPYDEYEIRKLVYEDEKESK